MINLKKNDKLIILIAVAVIVIAGIGIALYEAPEDNGDDDSKDNDKLEMYEVNWDLKSGSQTISDFADKNTPYEGTVSFNKGNLNEIVFNVSWIDDKAPLLGRFGLDTITVQIETPDGMTYEGSATSEKQTKEGNFEIIINVDGIPSTDIIEAEDMSEAESMLMEEPYYDDTWVNEDFKITVICDIGEIRILKKLGESGNDFTIDITYSYYDPYLVEMEDDTKDTSDNDSGDDPDPFDEIYETALSEFYKSMTYGRLMI